MDDPEGVSECDRRIVLWVMIVIDNLNHRWKDCLQFVRSDDLFGSSRTLELLSHVAKV